MNNTDSLCIVYGNHVFSPVEISVQKKTKGVNIITETDQWVFN